MLLREPDIAFLFYGDTGDAHTTERLDMESDLRRALALGQLELHYQPKVDARSGRITGAEALLRWRHPTQGLISPAQFIPMAEETGLIAPLGAWVLHTACAHARAWQARGLPPIRVAVNLSARQFHDHDLVTTVREALDRAGLEVAWLELEVTESTIMTDTEHTRRVLSALSEMGVRIAVDDFGTGYSSLAYLARFPIDSLKVDRSFVRGMTDDANVRSIVSAIVSLAHSMRMTVVAEGVERVSQADVLRAFACEEMQGFLYGRPVPEAGFARLLARGEPLLPAPCDAQAPRRAGSATAPPAAAADAEGAPRARVDAD